MGGSSTDRKCHQGRPSTEDGDQVEFSVIRKGLTQIDKFIKSWKSHSERTQGDLTDELTGKVLAKVDEVENIIESWVRTQGIQEQMQFQINETRQELDSITSQFRQLQD